MWLSRPCITLVLLIYCKKKCLTELFLVFVFVRYRRTICCSFMLVSGSHQSWHWLAARQSVLAVVCHSFQRSDMNSVAEPAGKNLWQPSETPRWHTHRVSAEQQPPPALQRSVDMSNRSWPQSSARLSGRPSWENTTVSTGFTQTEIIINIIKHWTTGLQLSLQTTWF